MRWRFWGSVLAGCLLALAGDLLACNSSLVDDVPTDLCASGKRWVGDVTPNERMFPGEDCVGCHQENDGPELMAAGTVYGLYDADGTRTNKPNCFGLEGVSVTITAWDGLVLKTLTNEAGNFYFEGRQASLKTPFSVVIEHTSADGIYSREVMSSSPSYGDCGRCHNPDAVGTPGAEPGEVLGRDEVVEGVAPLYTGQVDE